MTDPDLPGPDDARLSELLHDAVSDVEPREALDSIRNRTKVTPMPARPWTYAVGGAVVATAALFGAVAFAGDQLGLTGNDDTGPAATRHPQPKPDEGRPDPTDGGEPSASEPAHTTSSAPAPADALTLAAYYLGDTPQGPRLYREFDQVQAADPLAGAVSLLSSTPTDPDYSTPWQSGDLSEAVAGDEFIDVTVAGARADRPSGMSAEEAQEAVQQVVYTLQAAMQARMPVRFSTDTVLGVDTTEPVTNADPVQTLALVSITTPDQGSSVGGSFVATGVASSFEATVPWEIRQGDTVVKKGFTTAEGWMDKLYPWQAEIDVSDLSPGQYTFVAMTDDPSGGEGGGPHVDTRSITIE